ncbi:hypothetical protein TIFTF001_013667 [Ficus carica]|uniref:Uncharacterized protein n=1 Tax=Ficus carica TaxID=3494 RepID=A0AA88AI87_FICCA|nr:hypothetical protein TIFTF001_013667 [Ficus carica]
MPLYDCMLLLKPNVKKEALIDLVARVGKHVHRRNGVLTEVKSSGTVHLGYGIKKLDGRYFKTRLAWPLIAVVADGSLWICDLKRPIDADDLDGYSEHQQRAALPEQGRPIAALASG